MLFYYIMSSKYSCIIQPVISRLQGYFSALKKALHVADRPVVSDFLRTLFKVFLESFELCAASPPLRSSVRVECLVPPIVLTRALCRFKLMLLRPSWNL